jgi:hypothetical protein
MAKAAIESRKNVNETVDASVANLTKIALEPKETDATNSAPIPFDGNI